MSETARGFKYPASWKQGWEQGEKVIDKALGVPALTQPLSSPRWHQASIEASGIHSETLQAQTGVTLTKRTGEVVVHLFQEDGFYEASETSNE